MESSSPLATTAVDLPSISELSPAVISYLNTTFHAKQNLDFSKSTHLVSALQIQCDQLSDVLSDLIQRLQTSFVSHDLVSVRFKDAFSRASYQLSNLSSTTSFSRISGADGGGERQDGLMTAEQVVVEELPALAKEVARVEAVRVYAETAQRLDSLIGDIEDTVSDLMNRNLRSQATSQSSEELRLTAINSLKLTENILASVSKDHSDWTRLISAVDDRVDRALATLRPQAIADYRALLSSLGWPPPLSTLGASDTDNKKSSSTLNPLLKMRGEVNQKYFNNFLALCSLQELQQQRKSRQLQGRNREIALHQPLWAVEELVNPISVGCQQHFVKWVDQPEFIFALVYKITKDYVDYMDEFLQPLIDEARLTGYSSREEWIAAMVNSLSLHLAKEVFPTFVSQLDAECESDVRSQAKMSWLNLIDLMIGFDKRIQSLFDQSGILRSLQEDGNLERMSCLAVFSDRPDWLDLWANIELEDISDKLKLELDNERNWANLARGPGVHLPGNDHHKAPLISSIVLQHMSSMIERSKSLPNGATRLRYLRSVVVPILQKFLDGWLTKCLEAEGLTALATDDALIKVISSINSTRHAKSVLQEWSEDFFFLEVQPSQESHLGSLADKASSPNEGWEEEPMDSVFGGEMTKLEEFRKEWTEKIITVILRGFDALFRDYAKNRKQWQEKSEGRETVTKSFVVALDYLQQKLFILEEELNSLDFTTAWRSLAAGVDRLIFSSIFMSSVKFSQDGVERLGNDMTVLFGLFRAWCLRPEGFFPRVTEALKMIKMDDDQIRDFSAQGEEWMRKNGIRRLSLAEAEKISRCRVL